MKHVHQCQKSTKSEVVQLLSFEGFNAFEKEDLGIFTVRKRLCQKLLNIFYGRKERVIEHHFSPLIKCAEGLHNFAQTAHHFIGSQLLRRNGACCTLRFLQCKLRSENCRANIIFIPYRKALRNQFAKLLQLVHGTIYYCGRCVSPSHQRSFICVNQEPSSVLILPSHYINCYSQGRDRAYRLHPARPIGLCELVVISQDSDVDNPEDYEECDGQIGIFHVAVKSCWKGILA